MARVSGALFHEVRIPHVCRAISIRIEYGIKSSRGAPTKNHASEGQSNSATIVPVEGSQSTPYHLVEPFSCTIPVTERTRVVRAKSNAGDRLDVLSSKPLYSSPRQAERLLHMNSHMFTQDNGSSPGVWFVSLRLPGNGRKQMGRGGYAVARKPGVGFPSRPAIGCHDSS